jgi:hypothetical protein
MQDSLQGKKVTCPKCKSRFTALTDQEREREKEHLIKEEIDPRLEKERRKRAQEERAYWQQWEEEKRKEKAERAKAQEEMAKQPRREAAPISRTINCPDCGGILSKQAATCPHCGSPMSERKPSDSPKKPTEHLRVFLALLVVFVMVGLPVTCLFCDMKGSSVPNGLSTGSEGTSARQPIEETTPRVYVTKDGAIACPNREKMEKLIRDSNKTSSWVTKMPI